MLISFLICFFASAVGAICGIGGGVVIKPLLELFLDLPITVIHFLSSSTVLCMSAYSVGSSVGKGDRKIDFAIGTPLAVGAACGGIVGKKLFSCFAESVSVLQSWLLIVAMLACLVYTIWQEKFPSFCVRSTIGCALAGLALGIFSGFLGIGGGPINLMVLMLCFAMGSRKASVHSLYVILFSQSASFIITISNGLPEVDLWMLGLMSIAGILGGIVGRCIHKTIRDATLKVLLIGSIIGVIVASSMNLLM